MTDAVTVICNRRFHQRVKLNTQYGELSVSYADIGCATGPVLLYLPGMFASRYLGIPMHLIAERAGVRLLVVDRPGMGASTDVEPADRFDAWVDMVPRLLAHLTISRVNLAAHSSGTMYLFNTWARCRELIGPVVTLIAPFVDVAHSRVTSLQAAQYIPTMAFGAWHHIPRFFVTQASPVFASSGALVRRMSMTSGLGGASQEADRTFLDANYRRVERDYGVPVKQSAELARLAVEYMFAENTVGANSEALHCLKKVKGGDWGFCDDYAVCAKTLGARERTRKGGGRGSMTLRVFHAETDALVGMKGQKYLEECWRNLGEGSDGVEFISRVVDGTDHDTVSQAVEVWEEIFASIR
ncbi:Alpha/Beta hydrolase protein [Aspergillus karnatakaensis]|uniref:alpha/beta fold hydrolase n=1 Tax=Aspergillus karnatakaensis TaxID=1810916 RepID=UPI003CCDE0CA